MYSISAGMGKGFEGTVVDILLSPHFPMTHPDFSRCGIRFSTLGGCPESSMFLELLDLDVVPLPLLLLPLLLKHPRFFELAALLQAPRGSTSDRPFSKARTSPASFVRNSLKSFDGPSALRFSTVLQNPLGHSSTINWPMSFFTALQTENSI
nr:hypothetical protein Iba_chr01eCG1290 [Ipomoea batatas]